MEKLNRKLDSKLKYLLQSKKEKFVFVDIAPFSETNALLANENDYCNKVFVYDVDVGFINKIKNNANNINNIVICEDYKQIYKGDVNKGEGEAELESTMVLEPEFVIILNINANVNFNNIINIFSGKQFDVLIDELFMVCNTYEISRMESEEFMRFISRAGLKKIGTNDNGKKYSTYYHRPDIYKIVEKERYNLGCWENNAANVPRYSICVCNYNMADTLERAMSSVVEQLDEQYEVLVVDDGSTDNSLEVLKILSDKYDSFRYISLPRDRKRLLGETRNISIRAARGEYVLLHIDADDEWQPFLKDLVKLFHKIETKHEHDMYLSGHQTGIGKRSLMLSFGPYENIYRCEDRNLMMKLAKRNRIVFLDYKVYRKRMSRPAAKKYMKVVRDACSQMMFDLRHVGPKKKYIIGALLSPIIGSYFSLPYRIFRAFIVVPVYMASRFHEKIIPEMKWADFQKYHEDNRGTYSELMTKLGGDNSLVFLSEESQKIYSYDAKLPGFKSS